METIAHFQIETSSTDVRIINRTPPSGIHDCEFGIPQKKNLQTTSLNVRRKNLKRMSRQRPNPKVTLQTNGPKTKTTI
jgi:hypothetical protein